MAQPNACYNCGQFGHFARDCPARIYSQNYNNQRGGYGGGGNSRANRGQRSGSSYSNGRSTSSLCYQCGQAGHFARDCNHNYQNQGGQARGRGRGRGSGLARRQNTHSSQAFDASTTASNDDTKSDADQIKQNIKKTGNGFAYSVVKGDLFSCPESSSLAHCIARDLGMGKGIAVLFKKKFGGVDSMRKQNVKVGEAAILFRDNRYIYNLVTKERSFHKPTYDTIRASIEYMRNHAVINNVSSISMPKIGCGLDRLQWQKVETIIHNAFKSTNVSITVYEL